MHDFQAFKSGFDALSLEESYEKFDYAIIVAMECSNLIGPKNGRDDDSTAEAEKCKASGSFYEEQTTQLVSLEATMNSTQGRVRLNFLGTDYTLIHILQKRFYSTLGPNY